MTEIDKKRDDQICRMRLLGHSPRATAKSLAWRVKTRMMRILSCLISCSRPSPAGGSPVKGCGKTTLLDVLAQIVYHPLPAPIGRQAASSVWWKGISHAC